LRDEQQPPAIEAIRERAGPWSETRIGRNWEKLRTPSRNAECVSRYTSSEAARFRNQVPLADAVLPRK
jgi:hypothetical protein